MSFMKGPHRPKFDLETDVASPLAVATSSADRETLAMVAAALSLRRMRLAFQPAVYAADPAIIGFYEGYIRLLDPQDRVIPARDFMEVAETQELGREIDVAALQLGLLTLQKHPGIRVAVNMSARSIGYKKWAQTLRQALKTHPGLGRGLILEISEASAMQMPDVLIPFMKDLRAEQIAFTLDDFGAGATSLDGCCPNSASTSPSWTACSSAASSGARRTSPSSRPPSLLPANSACSWWPNPSKPRPRRTGCATMASAACRAICSARPRWRPISPASARAGKRYRGLVRA
jgi:hypothetical protein